MPALPAPGALPNRRRLPPLGSLRVFEAVARHLNIARAADELGVTAAAVSHQIRQLEDHLGSKVFSRAGRRLVLTDAGQICLPGIRDGFERLSQAIRSVDALEAAGILTVSVAPSFAAKWLVPRLYRFQARHPEIDVRVAASNQLASFVNDDVDLAIRYGAGHYPGLNVDRLLSEAVLPVCSPTLAADKPIRSPADLGKHTLLHDDSPDEDQSCPTWPMWLQAAGVVAAPSVGARGLRFTQSSMVLEAAIHGRGVALAKAALAETDIVNGRLVRLFAGETPIDFAYFIVRPERRPVSPKVDAFAQWLKYEVSAGPGHGASNGTGVGGK